MKAEYQQWIKKNVCDYPLGSCRSYTERMVKAFPELRAARGFYHCPIWDRREHWWCVTPNNKIVDPTAMQFPSKGTGKYEEVSEKTLRRWVEEGKYPTGKCPNCGGYCYKEGAFCSEECEQEFMASLCDTGTGSLY